MCRYRRWGGFARSALCVAAGASLALSLGERPQPSARPSTSESGAQARVENQSDESVLAYVLAGGVEWRLGEVAAGYSRDFALPPQVARLDAYRLLVRFTNAESRLGSVAVSPTAQRRHLVERARIRTVESAR